MQIPCIYEILYYYCQTVTSLSIIFRITTTSQNCSYLNNSLSTNYHIQAHRQKKQIYCHHLFIVSIYTVKANYVHLYFQGNYHNQFHNQFRNQFHTTQHSYRHQANQPQQLLTLQVFRNHSTYIPCQDMDTLSVHHQDCQESEFHTKVFLKIKTSLLRINLL